jgi:hypothetical protein
MSNEKDVSSPQFQLILWWRDAEIPVPQKLIGAVTSLVGECWQGAGLWDCRDGRPRPVGPRPVGEMAPTNRGEALIPREGGGV